MSSSSSEDEDEREGTEFSWFGVSSVFACSVSSGIYFGFGVSSVTACSVSSVRAYFGDTSVVTGESGNAERSFDLGLPSFGDFWVCLRALRSFRLADELAPTCFSAFFAFEGRLLGALRTEEAGGAEFVALETSQYLGPSGFTGLKTGEKLS